MKKIMSLITALTDDEGRPVRDVKVANAPMDGFLVSVVSATGVTRKWFTLTIDLANEVLSGLGGTVSHETHTGAIFYRLPNGGTGIVLAVPAGHRLLNVDRR